MSRKVILIAGVLVAAGSVAALSSPQVRGSRLGTLIEDTVFGSADDDGRDRAGAQDRASRKRDRAARRKAEQPAANSVDDGDDNDGRQARKTGERRAHARDDARDDDRRDESRNETRSAAGNDGRGPRRFTDLDRNGDGVIDADEFAAAAAERARIASRRFFRRFDADHDGKVTKEEFSRASRERIASAGRDDDGDTADADLPPRVRGRDVVR